MANAKKIRTETQKLKNPVKGGWVVHDAGTGKLVSVTSRSSTSYASETTRKVIGGASIKRSGALERLVNR
jgi:hypothetical protein